MISEVPQWHTPKLGYHTVVGIRGTNRGPWPLRTDGARCRFPVRTVFVLAATRTHIYSTVSPQGTFTQEVEPSDFLGTSHGLPPFGNASSV
jgi:hypothetical protein